MDSEAYSFKTSENLRVDETRAAPRFSRNWLVALTPQITHDRCNIAFALHRFRQSNLCFTLNAKESVAV